MNTGTMTRFANNLEIKLLEIYPLDGTLDFYNMCELDEETVRSIRKLAEDYDLGMYIKRALYIATTDESERIPGEYAKKSDNWLRDILYAYIDNCPKNSQFRPYKEKIPQYVRSWINSDIVNKKTRKSLIELALISQMKPEILSHILKVKLGQSGLNSLNSEEAIVIYVLQNELGFDGYINLKAELGKKIAILEPEMMLNYLKKNRSEMTRTVNNELMKGNLGKEEFLNYIVEQPLTQYSEALRNYINRNDNEDVGWEDAIEKMSPGFADYFPRRLEKEKGKETKKGKEKKINDRKYDIETKRDDVIFIKRSYSANSKKVYDYIRQHFPGFSIYGETSRIAFENLFDRNSKKTSDIRRKYDKKRNEHGEDMSVDFYPYFLLEDMKAEHEEGVKAERFSKEENDKMPKGVLPKWCKNTFGSALSRTHVSSIKEGKVEVLANDIILMKLWELDLRLRERVIERKSCSLHDVVNKKEMENYIEDFIAETNTILRDCNMGRMNWNNPFHLLVRIALNTIDILPLDRFFELVEIVGLVESAQIKSSKEKNTTGKEKSFYLS